MTEIVAQCLKGSRILIYFIIYYKTVLWQGVIATASFVVTVHKGSFNSGHVSYLKKGLRACCW